MKRSARTLTSLLLALLLCLSLLPTFATADAEYTVTFDTNGGSDAFNLSWTDHSQYPERWAMEPVAVDAGASYTLPDCTMVPPDWKMFDHWQVVDTGTNTVLENSIDPGDAITVNGNVTVLAIWKDRTWDTQFTLQNRAYDGSPEQFFVHQFLSYYVPADMVKYNANGNKDPYEQNIYIRWYAVDEGVRGACVSNYMFYSPSESAPGGAYIQAEGPSDVGDYELVLAYKGTEVINQFFSITEAETTGHTFELYVTLDKFYDGEPVEFDPSWLIIDGNDKLEWSTLVDEEGYRYIFQQVEIKGKEEYYVDLDEAPSAVGEYRLAIQQGNDKEGYTDVAAFRFAIEPLVALQEELTGAQAVGYYTIFGETTEREFPVTCHNYAPTCVRYGIGYELGDGQTTNCFWHYQNDATGEEIWFAGLYENGQLGYAIGEYGTSGWDNTDYFNPFLGDDLDSYLSMYRALPLGHTYTRSGHCVRCEQDAALYTRVNAASELKTDGTKYTVVGEINDEQYFLGFSSDARGWAVPVTAVDGGLWASTPANHEYGYIPMEFTLTAKENGCYGMTSIFEFQKENGTWAKANTTYNASLETTSEPQDEYLGANQILFDENGRLELHAELDLSWIEDDASLTEQEKAELIAQEIDYARLKIGLFPEMYEEGEDFIMFVTNNEYDSASFFGPVYLYTADDGEPAEPAEYMISGAITGGSNQPFTVDPATGSYEYTAELTVGDGINEYTSAEFLILKNDDGEYVPYIANTQNGFGTYVFDSVTDLTLARAETESPKPAVLVASHSGSYKFILPPDGSSLTVERTYADQNAEPYQYLAGFDQLYVLGDVMGAIQFAAGNDFWSPPTRAEVPQDAFDKDETILWSTMRFSGGEGTRYFLVGEDGTTYAKSSPAIGDVGENGVTLQLEAGSDEASFRCTLQQGATGVYDFYYGSTSRKLVVKRRIVNVTYDATSVNTEMLIPNPTISPNGTILSGDEVTLTAAHVQGHRFLGWYQGDYTYDDQTGEIDGDSVCAEYAYSFCPTNSVAGLHALYEGTNDLEISEDSFPDAVFRVYVAEELDTNHDGFLSETECNAVTVIDIYGELGERPMEDEAIVASLSGIHYFPNLEVLCCNPMGWGAVDDSLTAVGLSANTKLKIVNLNCNQLTALDVTMLPDLEELYVGFTYLTSIDVTHNPELNKLLVNDLYVEDDQGVVEHAGISGLDLSNNAKLAHLDCCGNKNLTQIDIGGCPILMGYVRAGERHIDLPYLAGIHVYGGEGYEYHLAINDWMHFKTVTITASAVCDEESIGDVTISPSGIIFPGEIVTLTAPSLVGYRFKGWYGVDRQLTEYKHTYSFRAEETDNYVRYFAEYDVVENMPNAKVQLVLVNGASCTIEGYRASETEIVFTGTTDFANLKIGTVLKLHAVIPEGAVQPLQWENGSGKLLGRSADLTLTITGNTTIRLIYRETNTALVTFVTAYDQVLLAVSCSDASTLVFPDPPSKLGYDFEKWVLAGTQTEATAETLQAQIDAGEPMITVKPSYTKKAETYSVTVSYGNADGRPDDVYENVPIGTNMTITAPEIEGKVFLCWMDGKGRKLSYLTEYYFKVTDDMAFIAVYGNYAWEAKPVVSIGDLTAEDTNGVHRVSAMVTRSIPDTYTVIEHGVLYARDVQGLDEDTFVYGSEIAGVGTYTPTTTGLNGTVKLNVTVATDNVVVWMRGYLIVMDDTTGYIEYYYSDIRHGSYNSPNQ